MASYGQLQGDQKIEFRTRYNNLKRISTIALKTCDEFTKFRGVHRDTKDIENHTRYSKAIMNKWYELRRDMIRALGTYGLEIESLKEPEIVNTDPIDMMWHPWRLSKECIKAVKEGLRVNKL